MTPKKVELVKSSQQFQLQVDGEPFYIKGAGLELGSIESLARYGGNAFRTWRVANGEKRLDIAFEKISDIKENASGLKVYAKSILALISEKSMVDQFVSRMVYVEPSSFTSIHDGSYIST